MIVALLIIFVWGIFFMTKKKWIKGAIEHKGSLRRELGVKKGEKISQSQLKKAEKSSNLKMRRQAHLAETLEKLPRHRGK